MKINHDPFRNFFNYLETSPTNSKMSVAFPSLSLSVEGKVNSQLLVSAPQKKISAKVFGKLSEDI